MENYIESKNKFKYDELGEIVRSNILLFLINYKHQSKDQNIDESVSDTPSDPRIFEKYQLYTNKPYGKRVLKMATQRKDTLHLNFKHIMDFNEDLAQVISNNFFRVEMFIRMAAQDFIGIVLPEIVKRSDGTDNIFFISIYNAPV